MIKHTLYEVACYAALELDFWRIGTPTEFDNLDKLQTVLREIVERHQTKAFIDPALVLTLSHACGKHVTTITCLIDSLNHKLEAFRTWQQLPLSELVDLVHWCVRVSKAAMCTDAELGGRCY